MHRWTTKTRRGAISFETSNSAAKNTISLSKTSGILLNFTAEAKTLIIFCEFTKNLRFLFHHSDNRFDVYQYFSIRQLIFYFQLWTSEFLDTGGRSMRSEERPMGWWTVEDSPNRVKVQGVYIARYKGYLPNPVNERFYQLTFQRWCAPQAYI